MLPTENNYRPTTSSNQSIPSIHLSDSVISTFNYSYKLLEDDMDEFINVHLKIKEKNEETIAKINIAILNYEKNLEEETIPLSFTSNPVKGFQIPHSDYIDPESIDKIFEKQLNLVKSFQQSIITFRIEELTKLKEKILKSTEELHSPTAIFNHATTEFLELAKTPLLFERLFMGKLNVLIYKARKEKEKANLVGKVSSKPSSNSKPISKPREREVIRLDSDEEEGFNAAVERMSKELNDLKIKLQKDKKTNKKNQKNESGDGYDTTRVRGESHQSPAASSPSLQTFPSSKQQQSNKNTVTKRKRNQLEEVKEEEDVQPLTLSNQKKKPPTPRLQASKSHLQAKN